jgi:hypothetical protein
VDADQGEGVLNQAGLSAFTCVHLRFLFLRLRSSSIIRIHHPSSFLSALSALHPFLLPKTNTATKISASTNASECRCP